MLRLKLSAPYEQVYVFISLENPLTGQVRTIDAKVDTGAAVTVIPKSVEHIASQAFWFCVDLREISIPEGVKTIGKRAFVGCEKLRKVVLPVTLENIEEDELWGGVFDSYVKQIVIPRGHKERFIKMGLKQYEEVIIEQ